MTSEIKNAIIRKATISRSDYGCLMIWLDVEYGSGVHQGFGGYNLYNGTKKVDVKSIMGHYMWSLMDVAGVDDWDMIVGKCIRVEVVDHLVYRIGHIIEDIWFCPKEAYKDLK